MKEIKLFSNWDQSKEYKYYYQLGRLNKDGSVRHYTDGGCSNDEAEVGEKVKHYICGKCKYLYVIKKTVKEEE